MNVVRAKMVKKMVGENDKLTKQSKVDLSRIPPCQNSLIPHIQRVNHRVAGYKRAHQAIVESPTPFADGQGWERSDQDGLQPIWSKGPVLPTTLVDLLEPTADEAEGEEEEEDGEDYIDFDFDALTDDEDD